VSSSDFLKKYEDLLEIHLPDVYQHGGRPRRGRISLILGRSIAKFLRQTHELLIAKDA
jgi:hypothetical protein